MKRLMCIVANVLILALIACEAKRYRPYTAVELATLWRPDSKATIKVIVTDDKGIPSPGTTITLTKIDGSYQESKFADLDGQATFLVDPSPTDIKVEILVWCKRKPRQVANVIAFSNQLRTINVTLPYTFCPEVNI